MPSHPRAVVIATLTATLTATATCLPGLGAQPLSWDEAVSRAAAEHPVHRLFALLAHTDAPLGAYYLAMHGWPRALHALGAAPTAGWLRLPSAVAAIAAVALTAWTATGWFGAPVGLTAGVLLAVHPLFVFYAHDARPYTLATLLVVAASALFVRARRHGTAGALAAYLGTLVAATYAHLFAALAAVGHAAVSIRGPRRGRWALVWLCWAVAAAPLVYLGTRQAHEIGWIPRPSPQAVASVLVKVAGGAAMAVALLAILVRAPLAGWRTAGERTWVLVGWAAGPPLLLVAADLVTPVLVARYALVAVPALAVAVAAVALRPGRPGGHHRRLALGLLVAAVVAGAVTSGYQQTRPYKYEDYRAAADLVDDNAQPGDAMVFVPAANRVGYDVYAGRRADRDIADVALRPGAGPQVADLIAGREWNAAGVVARLRGRDRVFLVGVPPDGVGSGGDGSKLATLRAGYHPAWSRRFGQVTVSLWIRPPAEPLTPLS